MAKTAVKKPAPKSEHNIKRAIYLEIGARPDILILPQQVGTFLAFSGHKVKVGQPGVPDILGIWARKLTIYERQNPEHFQPRDKYTDVTVPWGFCIETKTKDGRLRPEQEDFRVWWEKFGGIYIVGRDVADVRRVFGTAPQS